MIDTAFKQKQKTLFSRLKRLRDNPTLSEMILSQKLDSLNEKYIFQKGFIKGNFYCIVDFYLPKRKLVIEVDGGYHFSDSQRKKDYAKDNYLKSRNFSVLHLSNDTVCKIPTESLSIILNKY